MASGDLKGKDHIIIEGTSGVACAIGDLVHVEMDDGKWDKTADGDTGKFGVALDAAGAADVLIRVCIYGEVEVKATAAAIYKGAYVIADAGLVKNVGTISETTVYGTVVGTAMTAFVSGGQGTIFVGMM